MGSANLRRAAVGPACAALFIFISATAVASASSPEPPNQAGAQGEAIPLEDAAQPLPADRPRSACPNARRSAGQIGHAAATRALLCVINRARTSRGLARLRLNARLTRVATRHSRDMVRRGYFRHDTKNGPGWSARVSSSGYVRRARTWHIGETLAWAVDGHDSARGRLKAWLDSKPHRRVLLGANFREVGIGLASGTPIGKRGTTFTADFGRVR